MTAPRSSTLAMLVAGAFFMENLDATVIVTALPQMAASFGTDPVELNIGVSAYVLALAVLIPASGWFADQFGARRIFTSAIAVFTLSSILCGFSTDLWSFTAARILQGVGGAMMVPVGRLVVLRSTEKRDLLRAVATITWPGLAAPVLGPPVGGFITTYASWRWIFFLNVPLGIVALALALWLVPDTRAAERKPFDGVGFVLTGLACFCIMGGIELVTHSGGAWCLGSGVLGAGIVLGLAAVWHAKRHAHPLVEFWALRLETFAVTIWSGSLFRISISAVPFVLPLLFQISFGLDPFASGLLVLAVFAGNIAMKPLTTPVLRRFSFRTVILVNGGIAAATILACSLISPDTPVAIIAAILFASGLARSMQFTCLATLAFADVPPARMSGANTLFNTVQQMAMGLGIAGGATALRLAAGIHENGGAAPTLADFHLAFAMIGVIAILAVLAALRLTPHAGEEVRGQPPSTAPRPTRVRPRDSLGL